jgi:hypothetical protein
VAGKQQEILQRQLARHRLPQVGNGVGAFEWVFDAQLPAEPDGAPVIAFNPWFGGAFNDSGQGNGVSCHARSP